MIARGDSARRSTAVLGGLVLAAILSAADFTAPSLVAAQTVAGEKALLGFFDAGLASFGGEASQADARPGRFPSPEGALLGKVSAKVALASTADAQVYPVRMRTGAEQALLGRRTGQVPHLSS